MTDPVREAAQALLDGIQSPGTSPFPMIPADLVSALRIALAAPVASTEGERERGFREGIDAAAVVAQEEAHCNERRALRAITAGTSWEWRTAASSCRSIEAAIRVLRAPPPATAKEE
jgi:hypothetical protein